jgi:hypothetical protein
VIQSVKNEPKTNKAPKFNLSIDTLPDEFWQEVQRFGIDYRGDRLKLRNWHREYCEIISDFRIAETYTTGAAQVGKTVIHTFFLIYLITEKQLNTIWTYAQERTLNKLVPRQFRSMIREYLKLKGVQVKQSEGTKNNTLYQYHRANGSFTYTSTSNPTSSGLAAAGGVLVGEDCDVAFLEERSQYPPGSDSAIRNRLDASRISTQPVRQLGTPGGGLGIEAEIDKCAYYFYPHVICQGCREAIALNPKGTLLKIVHEKYLSESGRPIDWYHSDIQNAKDTAYFACPHCDRAIDDNHRTQTAFFQCLNTKIPWAQFKTQIPNHQTTRLKLGINLSPLLRETSFNLASDLIQKGFDTSDPNNWQQQTLGLPSESGNTAITLEMLKSAIAAPTPSGTPSFVLSGIDQGRQQLWGVIIGYYLPDNWELMTFWELSDRTIRKVFWAGDIVQGEIQEKLQTYGVHYGLIDNEPNISLGSELCEITGVLEIADQVMGQFDEFKEGIVNDWGVEYPCWKIRSDKYLRQVLNGFAVKHEDYPLYRLPDYWSEWLNKPSELSPLRHLTSVAYDPSSGRWQRPKDHIDDVYYAFHFCEAAFAIYLREHSDRVLSNLAYG